MKKVLLLVIWLVFLTSCGRSQPTTAIKVNMTDFAYNPNRFVVPSGREITLDIVNNGSVVHNFIVMKADVLPDQNFHEMDESSIYWKFELTPGQNATTYFTAPSEAGEYLIVCSTEGHYEAGMTAKLVVVAE
jgi:uncharacterized cupredoxin-like copper-binding protein